MQLNLKSLNFITHLLKLLNDFNDWEDLTLRRKTTRQICTRDFTKWSAFSREGLMIPKV